MAVTPTLAPAAEVTGLRDETPVGTGPTAVERARPEMTAPRLSSPAAPSVPEAALAGPARVASPAARPAASIDVMAPVGPRPDWADVAPAVDPYRSPAASTDREPATTPNRRAPGYVLVVQYRAEWTAAARRAFALAEELRPLGFEIRLVDAGAMVIRNDRLRYFRPGDAGTARELARRLDGEVTVQDFTHYRPPPLPGTLELWLASGPR